MLHQTTKGKARTGLNASHACEGVQGLRKRDKSSHRENASEVQLGNEDDRREKI
jgi:hypothetical protein